MKYLGKIIPAFLIGIGIGRIIEIIISLFVGEIVIGVPSFVAMRNPLFVITIEAILYGGFGVIGVLASFLYDSKKTSLLKATSAHLCLLLIYYVFVGLYLRWFLNTIDIMKSVAIYLVIYFIIWTTIYFLEKKKIEEINKELTKNNN